MRTTEYYWKKTADESLQVWYQSIKANRSSDHRIWEEKKKLYQKLNIMGKSARAGTELQHAVPQILGTRDNIWNTHL